MCFQYELVLINENSITQIILRVHDVHMINCMQLIIFCASTDVCLSACLYESGTLANFRTLTDNDINICLSGELSLVIWLIVLRMCSDAISELCKEQSE